MNDRISALSIDDLLCVLSVFDKEQADTIRKKQQQEQQEQEEFKKHMEQATQRIKSNFEKSLNEILK